MIDFALSVVFGVEQLLPFDPLEAVHMELQEHSR